MSTSNKWNQVGQEVMDSVMRAVESGDFSGLSQSVGEVINETANSINRGIDTVGKEIERQVKMHGANVSNQNGIWSSPSQQSNTQARQPRTVNTANRRNAQTTALSTRYKRHLPGQAAGPVCLAIGIVGTSMLGIASVATGVAAVFTGVAVAIPVAFGIGALPFIGLISKATKWNRRNRRFRGYVNVIGNRGYCEIEDLARATGKRKSYIQKDLQDMLRRGYFLQGRMDEKKTTLIVDKETYQQYENAEAERKRREAEQMQWEKEKTACPDAVQRILTEGQDYIRHIHECNDAIPGEVMSQKLEKLEDIMRRIFEQVKKQPDSAEDLRKFMTYYLPTTRKLIDAYRELDGQPEYGTKIASTKKEIEDTLDTVNEAFENLFDSLFEDTAWDISSDISTMKVMLQQEGLTKNNDFSSDVEPLKF